MTDLKVRCSFEEAIQSHNESTCAEADVTADNDVRDSATPDFTKPEKSRSKPSHILTHLAFTRSKGIKDLAMKDLEKRKRAEEAEAKARKAAESRERKTRQDQEHKERQERRKASRERAKQNQKAKAERRAEEKRLNDYYGIRGFDPNAGMLHSNREGEAGGKAHDGPQGAQELQGSPSSQIRKGQTGGIEFGKPKDHHGKGHFSGHHRNCGERY